MLQEARAAPDHDKPLHLMGGFDGAAMVFATTRYCVRIAIDTRPLSDNLSESQLPNTEMQRRPFLLARAMILDRSHGDWHYDHAQQISIQETPSGPQPVALHEAAQTSSKTMHEPTDDDADFDGERCY